MIYKFDILNDFINKLNLKLRYTDAVSQFRFSFLRNKPLVFDLRFCFYVIWTRGSYYLIVKMVCIKYIEKSKYTS